MTGDRKYRGSALSGLPTSHESETQVSKSQVSINITDPERVSVDTVRWIHDTVYIDVVSESVTATVVLTESTVVDFVTEILRSAGIKHFAFNDAPSTAVEYWNPLNNVVLTEDDDEEYYYSSKLYNGGSDFGLYMDDDGDVIDLDDMAETDHYGYLNATW